MPSMANPESRSPSPTPAPPVADSPGTKAQALINIFNHAVKATLDKCTPANFASCFPTIAQYAPTTLNDVHRQIIDQLDRTWKANFEDTIAKRHVVKALNSLEQCVKDAKLRKERAEGSANGSPVEVPVPPHSLPPSSIHLAHLMPFLEEQTTSLNSELSTTQASNTELLSTITAQRAEIEALVRGLENVVHDLEASAQIMAQNEVLELSNEIRAFETEMKT
ncbi:Nnf1-domain-containing protein [Lindgomyces ingoldianus]|uniref:Nnf1-domain-containing protein n=1 Tax=Lindgomyces ingoldianus TaxID=673940 RepID=A0ACB6RAL2_9PLEO|nr:Nnf1-domain-containing protein [Lindgomyces ingoldianus]KAF2476358.1 Nnf1-domain-containing protein [Lindgomyces ingoldianus]